MLAKASQDQKHSDSFRYARVPADREERGSCYPKAIPKSRPWGWNHDGVWASDQQVKRKRWTSPEGRGSLKYVSHGALMGLISGVDMGIATLVLFLTEEPLMKPLEC